MGGGSRSALGALVPSVKLEPLTSEESPPETVAQAQQMAIPAPEKEEAEEQGLDKDVLCPICMQVIKDAFLTPCGHSFCYMCIITHLKNKSDCPCCSHYLTATQLYPNFVLNKLLTKTTARQIAKTALPVEQLRQAIEQGCDVSAKELESLLSLLSEKKKKMELEEAETNMQILFEFLQCLRKQKLDELHETQKDLQYIKEDIRSVEKYRIELYRATGRCSSKMRILGDESSAKFPAFLDKQSYGTTTNVPNAQGECIAVSNSVQTQITKAPFDSQLIQREIAQNGSDSQHAVARRRRVHAQFSDLQDCYLQKRRHWASNSQKQEERVSNGTKEGYNAGLADFQSVFSTFTRYSRLRVVAELRHADLFHSANIVSSIEFDRDDELFAIAGVSRRIKVFEFASVINEPAADMQCPIAEMPTRSKLSCLSWNKYKKNYIASSDYEGIVTVWDVTTRQSVMEYEEHEKRAWSVDFSRTEPSMLVSGSDDCKVKVWCLRQEASVLSIDMKANICSVKYNPGSSFHVAVGSADHNIYYYDLRNISQPLHIFSGHRKSVSYVKFLSNNELASASTESSLRLWDVKDNIPLRTFRGHTNEKNFVGLTVNSEYIACGSETNEVFVYHKAISKPAAWHSFGSDMNEADAEIGSYFISAVCWKSDSLTMLSANSQGTIKVHVLAA
ncbi:PREDICTED: E3 ubiquitin-protein ligase COP1-like isoform X1 [Ipomoea nil]|uniref:E3 ubiquitin-protein ligase COP1-like isoform X1 n=1 Tax=Ipomoea nil TaxID=35883 RepID=UPI000900D84D|nr:PREDICTED: E3 ubiquitin-protein ligase COP1-like isoform X1 [Ipomoea nil]